MDTRRHNLVPILATGVVTTIIVLTGLFWARSLCSTMRHNWLFHKLSDVSVEWTSPFLGRPGTDPNRVTPYVLIARPLPDAPLRAGLGLVQYVMSRAPTSPGSDVYTWNPAPDGECRYYDRTLGQIIYKGTKKVTRADGRPALIPFQYCAGPEGVALSADEKLGRFVDPIVDRFPWRSMLVYDRGQTRFFEIDWTSLAIRKGPQLPSDGQYRPVQIRLLEKNPQSLQVISMPSGGDRSGLSGDDAGSNDQSTPSTPKIIVGSISAGNRTLVLDASGRIDLLDTGTLELIRNGMHLRAPADLYAGSRAVTPEEVAAYQVSPISASPTGGRGDWTYAGCSMATLSRDGTAARLEVFDPNGQLVTYKETTVPQYTGMGRNARDRRTSIPSSQAAYYFDRPEAGVLTVVKLALESLHPPLLQFLTYFRASDFEATAGYRSLLLLPDSFLAMTARNKGDRPIENFLVSMVFMIPAIILVELLVWRVNRDGSRIGLSKNERTAWAVGTVILGLPVYITYRLMRPKGTLVTCANCGLGRRPDLEKCHHCGSPWVVPELVPPTWRVRDEGSPAALGWETGPTPPEVAAPQEEPNEQC